MAGLARFTMLGDLDCPERMGLIPRMVESLCDAVLPASARVRIQNTLYLYEYPVPINTLHL